MDQTKISGTDTKKKVVSKKIYVYVIMIYMYVSSAFHRGYVNATSVDDCVVHTYNDVLCCLVLNRKIIRIKQPITIFIQFFSIIKREILIVVSRLKEKS